MTSLNVLSPEPMEEERFDKPLRPQTLEEFTGQREVCQNLKIFIQAARQRGQALDHTLFYGPPGLGKTTLAQLMSTELGVGFRATAGPVISKAGDLAALLTNLQPKDVLFIDEIHRLNPSIAEVLYPAMEDYKLDLMIGEGPAARSIRIDLPPFTLVGATTRKGLLTSPLRDRFGIHLRLEFYSLPEMKHIVHRELSLLGLKATDKGIEEIAQRSRGTPRIAGRLTRRVRDFALVHQAEIIDERLADEALQRLGVDVRGLDLQDRRYLECIAHTYSGGPVGLETLAAVLSEQKDTVEEVIEPYLLQKGLIQRTSRGRLLAKEGYVYLGLEMPQDSSTLTLLDPALAENDD